MKFATIRTSVALFTFAAAFACSVVQAETCVTQSAMQPADRQSLADAAQALALKVQANDQAGIRATTIPEFASNFNGMATTITSTSPKLAGSKAEVEQVYLLDASTDKRNDDGSWPNAEFVCSLNKGINEADFSIPSLPAGRYGFAMVQFTGANPWMVSMLLRQDGQGAPWKLAGLFPKPSLAAGHDGLWYWRQGRAMAAGKQLWTAYMYFQEAQNLLRPALFVSSTHLENLRAESTAATPPELGDGVSESAPLVVKGTGEEYRFVSIAPDDSLNKGQLDIVLHMVRDPAVKDTNVITTRNRNAATALIDQHPELRSAFHGVWVIADAPGTLPIASQLAMNEIP